MPRSDDYIPVGNDDHEGFTVSDKFQRDYERKRERAERLEREFLEGLKADFRKERARLAREFMEYNQKNPEGGRVRLNTVWGGEAGGSDYTGYTREMNPETDEE